MAKPVCNANFHPTLSILHLPYYTTVTTCKRLLVSWFFNFCTHLLSTSGILSASSFNILSVIHSSLDLLTLIPLPPTKNRFTVDRQPPGHPPLAVCGLVWRHSCSSQSHHATSSQEKKGRGVRHRRGDPLFFEIPKDFYPSTAGTHYSHH